MTVLHSAAGCAPNTHKCYTSYPDFVCLPQSRVCDGTFECEGATDEADCGTYKALEVDRGKNR